LLLADRDKRLFLFLPPKQASHAAASSLSHRTTFERAD
jgi:hypothetical protein